MDLFVPDSTNAEVPGFTTSEKDLTPAIEQVFRTCPGRVIVSSFASHVHRIQQVLDAARDHGRKVAFVGRSMVRNMGIARDLGYLDIPDGLVVDLKQLEKLPANKITLICTGSQGEPMAALSRMANRDHPIRVTEGDTVLLASSLIPGNENAIYRVINELTRWGAHVVHKGNAKVHVSGHASAGELVVLLQHRQARQRAPGPRRVAPPQGQRRPGHQHRRPPRPGAHRRGRRRSSTSSTASPRSPARSRPASCSSTRMTVGGATEESLTVRRNLAEEGVVTIVALADPDTGKLTEKPDFLAHGFEHDESTFDSAVPVIQRVLTKASKDDIDVEQAEELIKQAVSTWAHRTYRRSPLIIPVVIDA